MDRKTKLIVGAAFVGMLVSGLPMLEMHGPEFLIGQALGGMVAAAAAYALAKKFL